MPLGEPIVELVGYLAAMLTTLAFIPQILKTWRTRSAEDLSLPTLIVFTTGVFLWLVYGIALRSGPMTAANATTFVLNLLLLGLKRRYDRRSDRPA